MADSPVNSDRKTRVLVHPLLQTARGSLVDEDYADVERLLGLAVDRAKDLEAEVERLREAVEWRENERRNALIDNQRLRAEVERLKEALEFIAAPRRRDGSYNRSREACEQLAREALALDEGLS